MTRAHPLAFSLCRQRIGDPEQSRKRWYERARWAYCNLAAHAWCFDCDHYVCDIHFEARHVGHDHQTRAEEIADPPLVEWRWPA